MSMGQPIIGIDLGTTNSVVAVTDHTGTTLAIAGADGERVVPSVVFFPEGADPIVGGRAKQYALVEPERVAALFKRGMGDEIFRADGSPFVVDGRSMRPEELSALVLRKMQAIAGEHLGGDAARAVITVPAYFGEAQRAATRQAGELAGLEVVRIVNEPTAAAIAHGLDDQAGVGHIVVFDLGGGTFDVTVLQRDSNGQIEVGGSGGDRRLGGADFDQLIVDRMIEATSPSLRDDPWALADAYAKAEDIKKELSSTQSSTRPLTVGGRPEMFTLTRADFEAMVAPHVRAVEDTILYTIEEAGLSASDIDQVLMVGGSSRIPMFKELLERIIGRQPVFSKNLDEDVARGAAILAAKLDEGSEASTALAHIPVPIDALTIGLGVSALRGDTHEPFNLVILAPGSPLPSTGENMLFCLEDRQPGITLTLNEGDDEDPDMVSTLGSSDGSFASPRPKDYPIRIVLEASVDGMITANAYDGKTNDFLAELTVKREGALAGASLADAKTFLASSSVEG